MPGIDRRTRSDADLVELDAGAFFTERFPALAEANGPLAVEGVLYLEARPLALTVEGESWTLQADGDQLVAAPGITDDAVMVELDRAQFSDWVQQQQSFNAMWVGHTLRATNGDYNDVAPWDAAWLALMESWPVVEHDLEFRDRHGAPLDLQQHFTPDDDPADIAHFIREAGYLHLRGWLDPAVMATIAADIDAAVPRYTQGDGRSWWATTSGGTERCVRLQHFVEYSPATVAMLGSDAWEHLGRVIEGDEQLVQDPVEGNCIEALVKPIGVVKGISDVPWHRDCNFGRHAHKCSAAVIGVSVTEGSAQSGQLRVVAGSHRVGMPPLMAFDRSYLPVVPLPTQTGDLTVHLSCTLHEAMPPVHRERMVMYTSFGLPPRPDDNPAGGKAISELREQAYKLRSQPPSPVTAPG